MECVTCGIWNASHLHKEFYLWLVGHLSLCVHVFLMDPENFLGCWWKTLLLFFSSWVWSDFVSLCQWGETMLTPDRGHTPSGLTCRTSRSGSVSSCMSVLCCLCIVSVPQKHDAASAIITIITCKADTLLWRLGRKFVRVLDGEVQSWKWAEILETPHLFCTQWSSQYTAWGVLSPLLFVKKLEFNINKDFWILDSLIHPFKIHEAENVVTLQKFTEGREILRHDDRQKRKRLASPIRVQVSSPQEVTGTGSH